MAAASSSRRRAHPLFALPGLRGEGRAKVVRLEDLPNLDLGLGAREGVGAALDPFDRFFLGPICRAWSGVADRGRPAEPRLYLYVERRLPKSTGEVPRSEGRAEPTGSDGRMAAAQAEGGAFAGAIHAPADGRDTALRSGESCTKRQMLRGVDLGKLATALAALGERRSSRSFSSATAGGPGPRSLGTRTPPRRRAEEGRAYSSSAL